MKRILLVEDDLSLISGLSFAVKKQGYLLDVAHTAVKQVDCGKTGNTIWLFWMSPCRMALVLTYAKIYGGHQRRRLCF